MTTVRPTGTLMTGMGRVVALVLAMAGVAVGCWAWAPSAPLGPGDKELLGPGPVAGSVLVAVPIVAGSR